MMKRYIFINGLSSADGLAKFLASRYPGMKRFGIEGAESLIPLVDSLDSKLWNFWSTANLFWYGS